MTALGFALVLAAACCHATWNYWVKRLGGGPELIWLFSLVSAVLYFPLAAWVVFIERPDYDLLQWVFILGSVLLHMGYFVLLQIGYRHGDLSLVYPTARATGPILSTGLAVLLLNEVVSLQMAVGAGVIIFGVLMLTGGFRGGSDRMPASLAFGLAAGLFIGSYTAWDAYAVAVLMISPILQDYASSIGRMVCLAPVAHRNWSSVRSFWRDQRAAVIIVALFNPLAYILVLYALTFTPVAYVAPLREVSVLLSVLAGSILLGEGHLKRRLGWAAVILVGMSLLVSG